MSTYREPYDRLRGEFKPRHLRNLCEYLTPRHRDGMKFSAVEPDLADSSNIAALATFLEENFDRDAINRASKVLSDEYARNKARGTATQADKPTRRGRPLGSKNKQQIDATADLETNQTFKGKQEAARRAIEAAQQTDKYDYDSEPDPYAGKKGLERIEQELRDDTATETKTVELVTIAKWLEDYTLKTEFKPIAIAAYETITRVDKLEFDHSSYLDEISKLQTKVANIQDNRPTIVTLERKELPSIEMGVQHKQFPLLLKMCSAGLRSGAHVNIWIVGPAGCGKSTAAENVATALELDFYTNGKMQDAFEITGYRDANGKYQDTQFRRAYENGGLYLADEIDGSMPDALLAMNAALANGHMPFPDKLVKRHPKFIFLAAANTTGQGGTLEYVGRFQQDAAFLDRFVTLNWHLDDALEDSLCANKDWLNRVRYVRARLAKASFKGHMITPRATIYGEALIAAGLTIEEAETATLRKGLTLAQWEQIR